RARASSWMDWQLTVAHPPLTPVFWGLIRTPPEKRDHAAIEAGKVKCIEVMKLLDTHLAKTAFVAGDTLSMGDIPVALMAYRFRRLVPERPPLDHLERWFAAIEQRPAFKQHVLGSRSCDGRSRVRRLQRLAAQELRHFTDEPGGLADEKMLQRGQTV